MEKEMMEEWIQNIIRARKMMHSLWKTKYFSLNELAVLFLIQKREAYMEKMGELCKALDMTKPALSQIIRKLADTGMVERVHSREDRRIIRLQITPVAAMRLEEERILCENAIKEIIVKMGEKDMEELKGLLRKLHFIIHKRAY